MLIYVVFRRIYKGVEITEERVSGYFTDMNEAYAYREYMQFYFEMNRKTLYAGIDYIQYYVDVISPDRDESYDFDYVYDEEDV